MANQMAATWQEHVAQYSNYYGGLFAGQPHWPPQLQYNMQAANLNWWTKDNWRIFPSLPAPPHLMDENSLRLKTLEIQVTSFELLIIMYSTGCSGKNV